MGGKSSVQSTRLFPNERKMGLAVHDILIAHYGDLASRRKLLARDADVSERTAENWLQRKTEPQVCNIGKIARKNPAFCADFIGWLRGERA